MENSITILDYPLAFPSSSRRAVSLPLWTRPPLDPCLHNLIPIIAIGGKLADVKMVAPDGDGLSNARIRGRLFLDNLM